jgi:hypothetical protein
LFGFQSFGKLTQITIHHTELIIFKHKFFKMPRTLSIPFLLLLLTYCSCRQLCKDQKPSIDRHDYTGTELRTDGYYYGEPTTNAAGKISYALVVFYRNGVFQYGWTSDDPMERMAAYVKFNPFNDKPDGWGAYTISPGNIKVSAYTPGLYCRNCYNWEYTIVNDTTIREVGKAVGGQYDPSNDTLNFVQFPKPDSTNLFYK